jgi:hypothetical protein
MVEGRLYSSAFAPAPRSLLISAAMLSPKLALLAVVACVIPAHSQNRTPNLAGIWRLDPQKGQHSFTPPEEMRVKIDQSGNDITIALRLRQQGNEEIMTHHYRAGSDDNRNEIHGAPMKSSARWEAGALLIDSVATIGGRELNLHDRWTVSPDGQTLTFAERHQFGTEPEGEEINVFDKLPNAAWDPPQPPKPAEQVFKNIQVLKGVPAPSVMPAMMFFTQALGVKCDHCHVPDQFDKDDKPAKAVARKMIQMVHQINVHNFDAKDRVTCWTCHRGSTEPPAAPK